jgi:type IX secretion system PorP/SprF family membrane protein
MDRHFHIGFSASQLLESAFVLGNSGIDQGPDIHYKRNYNLISSYKHEFKSGSEWEYEPSVMIKMYDPFYFKPVYSGPQVQADLMLRLICNRSYWFGVAYRTSKEYVALLGIRYENLYVSYSFDYGNNGISRNSYGSHELSVSLKFGDGARRVPWMERY